VQSPALPAGTIARTGIGNPFQNPWDHAPADDQHHGHECHYLAQRERQRGQQGTGAERFAFAAKHAEGVFISPATAEQAREVSDDIRNRAVAAGRSRDSVKVFTLLT